MDKYSFICELNSQSHILTYKNKENECFFVKKIQISEDIATKLNSEKESIVLYILLSRWKNLIN